MNGEPIPMPANQSTPEVTRADEARRLIEKLAGADIDVSGTAAIGITSADIIAANDWLSATPARGGDELREALVLLRDEDADPYSFSGDEDENDRVVSQHRFYRWGDDCVIAIGELNFPNQWDDEAFDAKCDVLNAALASTDMAGAGEKVDGAPERIWLCGFDTDHGDISWSADKDPTGDPDVDGKQVEYVRAAPPVEGLTSGEGIARAAAAMREEWLRRASDHPGDFFEAMAQVALAAFPKATATVEEAAINQNDRMRQELAHIGNLVSDLERAMHADPANPDGSWPDLAGRIERLKAKAKATATASVREEQA